MPGPPPKDPNARRRRNPTPGFKLLPHEGRSGPAPEWPLPNPDLDELRTWDKLWRLPQAVEWERMRCEDVVALYVRAFVVAAAGGVDPKLLAEVRQLDAKIGLSPKAMKDLRWETDQPEPEEESVGASAVDASQLPAERPRTYVPSTPAGRP